MKLEIFGESHGPMIGGVLRGVPAGISLDYDRIKKDMDRRKPGTSSLSTHRKEADEFEFVSGVLDGRTTGAPLAVIIRNSDTHSSDYNNIALIPRPNHSDYAAFVKYSGFNDIRGGGHFSGRLTAPLVCLGSVLKQALAQKGIGFAAHIYNIGKIYDTPLPENQIEITGKIPLIDHTKEEAITEYITKLRMDGDSAGGCVECGIYGMPAGLGGPLFEGIEGEIAHAVFGVPGVKGIEFGKGFGFSESIGSEVNDPFFVKDGQVMTKTNNCGGIQGGISNGMPIVFRAAMKPTPSIYKEQQSVNLKTMTNETLAIKGRHDPCIAIRAVPVIEAAAAYAVSKIIYK